MKYDWEVRVRKDTSLSVTEKMVLLTLVFHWNPHTGQCNPSIDLLAEECSLSKRGALDVLERLERKGKIEVAHGVGKGVTNQYTLFPGEDMVKLLHHNEDDKVKPLHHNGPECEDVMVKLLHHNEPEERVYGEVGARASYERRIYSSSSSAPARAREENSPTAEPPPPDTLTQALCDACALMPDALGEKHRGQLAEVMAWLRSIYPDDEAARVVAQRFAPGVWDKPKPPHLPQIKTDWKRMERIVEHANQTQNATDPNLRPDGDPGAPPRRRQREAQNDFQRNAADRRAARAELAAKYSQTGE